MTITKKNYTSILFVAMLLCFFIWSVSFSSSYTIGPNYKNISVDTTVNITNAKPEVLSVIIADDSGNITLNAGSTIFVECNASIRDWNGGGSLAGVNATFYDNVSSSNSDVDDNNTHYTNASCSQESVNGYYANYTCGFNIQYYANSSTWICNVTAIDSYDFNTTDSDSLDNFTFINELFALNVTNLIDYGNLAVEDTSTPQEANVTNFGNKNINVSVYGYGATPNDGLAMYCDVGNISIANQKYSLTSGADFTTGYTALTGTGVEIANLTVLQQTDEVNPVINQTYWRLYVPPNPFGRCNGTVVFQAESSI